MEFVLTSYDLTCDRVTFILSSRRHIYVSVNDGSARYVGRVGYDGRGFKRLIETGKFLPVNLLVKGRTAS